MRAVSAATAHDGAVALDSTVVISNTVAGAPCSYHKDITAGHGAVLNTTAAPCMDHQERESAFFFLLRKRRVLECDKICNSRAAWLSICKPGPAVLSLSVKAQMLAFLWLGPFTPAWPSFMNQSHESNLMTPTEASPGKLALVRCC